MSGPLLFDRVLESSTTTGTGTYTLAGARTGYQSFAAVGDGNITHYAAWEVDAQGNPSGGWEVGRGTYTASGTTLARTAITASSNAGAAVSWAAGTRYVGLVLPAAAITTFALTLLDDADASSMRSTLGLGSLATQSGTFSGTSSGTNTGDQTSVTGNAGTATALATARNIDGQSFDGTANITVIAPGTHAATSKATPVDADEVPLVDSAASNVLKRLTWANVKATLKTYFDTLYPSGSGTHTGTSSGTNTGDQTSVSGNAGTATALATARNIDGQAFDGTANITVIAPGTHAATSKATPVDADEVPLVDSAASNVLKRLTWANIKSTLFANPNIVGTATNDNAAAGSVGEFVESSLASGSAVNMTTGVAANITSISLTAGDWDVMATFGSISTNAVTSITGTTGSISTTTGTIDATAFSKGLHAAVVPGNGISTDVIAISRKRISISGTTTVYLVGSVVFSASSAGGFGRINARRVR